jgi:hypothetical protein
MIWRGGDSIFEEIPDNRRPYPEFGLKSHVNLENSLKKNIILVIKVKLSIH